MKQSRFFSSAEDLKLFFKWINQNLDVSFIKGGPIKNPKNIVLYKNFTDQIPEKCVSQYGHAYDQLVYLKFNDLPSDINFRYIEKQKYYLINQEISRLLEFSYGGIYNNKILTMGRIAIEDIYYDKDNNRIQIPELAKKYLKIVTFLKKNSITKASNSIYVLPGAYQLAKQGICLKIDNHIAYGYRIGPSGGLETYIEEKGLKFNEDGIITSQIDWSETQKANLWKEFP